MQYFNSSMVRLKARMQRAKHIILLFQFQYGAIKRLYALKQSNNLTHFNSSMVRLKALRPAFVYAML